MLKFLKDEAGYLLAITLIGVSLFLYGMVFFKVTHAQGVIKIHRKGSGTLIDLPKIQPTRSVARAPRSHVKPATAVGQVKIALIDTGYDPSIVPEGREKLKICPEGSYDFITHQPGLSSAHWHGTVTGTLIAEGMKDIDYCAVVYQVAETFGGIPDEALVAAVTKAFDEGVIAVNLSLGGPEYTQKLRMALTDLSDQGVMAFIAAGNSNQDLTEICDHYPACYQIANTYVVGAADDGFLKAPYSNYGVFVNAWYPGRVEWNGQELQGTSFAAPRALADYVDTIINKVKASN